MSKVKNQHFVPQFYLKSFSRDAKQINVFDKNQNKSFSSNIDSVACARFFYDWDELDKISGEQFIEKAFSVFEGEVSITFDNLIKRLEQNKFKQFSDQEKILLAEFIWFQMLRTQETRIQGGQLTKFIEEDLRKKGATEEFIINNNLLNSPNDEKKEHLKLIINAETAKRSVEKIYNRIWIAVVNKTNYSFYTSDNPIIRYTHWAISHLAYELFYPISPKYAIIILTKKEFNFMEQLNNTLITFNDKEYVKYYNQLQVIQSTRQIFCMEASFKLAEKMIREKPAIGDLNRPRINKLL